MDSSLPRLSYILSIRNDRAPENWWSSKCPPPADHLSPRLDHVERSGEGGRDGSGGRPADKCVHCLHRGGHCFVALPPHTPNPRDSERALRNLSRKSQYIAENGTSRHIVGATTTYSEERPFVHVSTQNSSIIPGGLLFVLFEATKLACRVRINSNGAVASDARSLAEDPARSGMYAVVYACPRSAAAPPPIMLLAFVVS